MLTKEEHAIVQQAAEILKREIASITPKNTDGEERRLLIRCFGSFFVRRKKSRAIVDVHGNSAYVPERVSVRFVGSRTWLSEV